MNSKLAGEQALENGLKRLRRASKREIKKKRVSLLQRVGLFFSGREAGNRIDTLTTELAAARFENQKQTELNQKYIKENKELKKQVSELLSNVKLDDISSLQNKADQFDVLQRTFSELAGRYHDFDAISSKVKVRALYNEMQDTLSDAVDDFQKIKIYRTYFAEFVKVDLVAGRIKSFMSDKENFKDRDKVQEVLTYLGDITGYEELLDRFITDAHPHIIKLLVQEGL